VDLTRSQGVSSLHAHSLSPALKIEHHSGALSFHIERTAPHCSARIDFDTLYGINQIRYESSLHVLVDVFWSQDGANFYRVHGVRHESQGELREFNFPLTSARFLQLNFYQEGGPVHKSDLRRFQVGFISRVKLKASTEFDRLWPADNLVDRREDYGWASQVHEKNTQDTIDVDLGGSFYVSEIRLKSLKDEYGFFPVGFQLQLAEDSALWTTVQSEDHFFAAPLTWHSWRFTPVRTRFVRLQIDKHAHYKKGEYQSKILDMAILGEPDSFDRATDKPASSTRMASENVPGIVLLASNNTAAANRVVQSNDTRLRQASTEYSGIMQFAKDAEASQERAVQGSDSRLQMATESSPGIVQLAKNGEVRERAVVQSNDARLRHASAEALGIVQLAKDGEAKDGVVVQGNDSRLKGATVESAGLALLARDGEEASGKAVQGNDSRLRTATQAWPGIMQFAGHNEIAGNKAVVADDPRLAEADESRKGRVQFAKKGESADLKAVQASDTRLQAASEDSRGVVQFARNGISAAGQAVQANDTRLADARPPKQHEHAEYALKEHTLNSHTGNLHLKNAAKTVSPEGFAPVNDPHIPILVENSVGLAAGFTGGVVVAADGTAGIFSSKTGAAIQAGSREASAATLISANAYALHLPRSVPGLKGSEKALHAEGHVLVDGQVTLKGAPCLSVALPKASSEAFVDGDLVTIENGVAAKMRSENQVCIGVVMKSAGLQIESAAAGLRVAVAGIVTLRVYGQVKAGDKLTLNTSQPGTCRVGQAQDKIFAVALEAAASDREKQVQSILVR
jgi:hypothetical protein